MKIHFSALVLVCVGAAVGRRWRGARGLGLGVIAPVFAGLGAMRLEARKRWETEAV